MVSAMQIETIGIIENFEDTDYLDVIVACPLTILTTIKRRRRKRRNRVIWVRSWVRNRMQFGAYNNVQVQLRNTDPISFQNFFRMDIATFEEVLALVPFYVLVYIVYTLAKDTISVSRLSGDGDIVGSGIFVKIM